MLKKNKIPSLSQEEIQSDVWERYINKKTIREIGRQSRSLKKKHKQGMKISPKGWVTRYDANLQ